MIASMMQRLMTITLICGAVALSGCSKKQEPSQKKSTATDETAVKDPPESPRAKEPDVRGEEVDYTAGGVTLKGYLAYDHSRQEKRPGVLVVHEWWGHNDYARKRARMLAEMGYTALAVDMYGGGKQAGHPDDAKKFMMEVLGNMEAGKARFEAARKLIQDHPSTDESKTAAIGYCFGGGVVLHMARSGMDLAGVASFHGSLATEAPAEKGKVKADVLVLHGAADPFVKPEEVEAFKKEMSAAEVKMQFHEYPGAKHAFTNPGATKLGEEFKLPLEYNAAADKESWAELDKFLKAVFSTALAIGCGSDDAADDGGNNNDNGSAALCTSGCEDTLTADCRNGPETQLECETDCNALRQGQCASEYSALLNCSDGAQVTCNANGIPVVEACSNEQGTFVSCINQ
jgi:dienelactone hydrolase